MKRKRFSTFSPGQVFSLRLRAVDSEEKGVPGPGWYRHAGLRRDGLPSQRVLIPVFQFAKVSIGRDLGNQAGFARYGGTLATCCR